MYYYDPETGQYYRDIEGTQPVEQPYPGFSEDPVEGWAIVRDDDKVAVGVVDQHSQLADVAYRVAGFAAGVFEVCP